MTLRSVFKLSERFIIDNAPTLLSAIAITGTGTIAYLTGKAAFKASKILEEERVQQSFLEPEILAKAPDLDKTLTQAKLTWKCYIPPAVAVAGTVGCIVFSHKISASRLAGMAAAYKLSEKHYAEYKDKVLEMLGEKTDEKITDAVHADAVAAHPLPYDPEDAPFPDDTFSPGIQKQWCFDLYSGRYFRSDVQTLRAIANDINTRVIEENRVPLSDFYDALGLKDTKLSGELGWTLKSPLDFKFSSHLSDDNGKVPVMVVDFRRPLVNIRDYSFCDEDD